MPNGAVSSSHSTPASWMRLVSEVLNPRASKTAMNVQRMRQCSSRNFIFLWCTAGLPSCGLKIKIKIKRKYGRYHEEMVKSKCGVPTSRRFGTPDWSVLLPKRQQEQPLIEILPRRWNDFQYVAKGDVTFAFTLSQERSCCKHHQSASWRLTPNKMPHSPPSYSLASLVNRKLMHILARLL